MSQQSIFQLWLWTFWKCAHATHASQCGAATDSPMPRALFQPALPCSPSRLSMMMTDYLSFRIFIRNNYVSDHLFLQYSDSIRLLKSGHENSSRAVQSHLW